MNYVDKRGETERDKLTDLCSLMHRIYSEPCLHLFKSKSFKLLNRTERNVSTGMASSFLERTDSGWWKGRGWEQLRQKRLQYKKDGCSAAWLIELGVTKWTDITAKIKILCIWLHIFAFFFKFINHGAIHVMLFST